MKSSHTMHKCLLAAMIGALAPVMVMPTDSYAQATAATVRGRITSGTAPAAGADITATNTATGLIRRARAGANGDYVLNGLPPGTYRIEAVAGGQTSSQVVTARIGQTATLNVPIGAQPVTPAEPAMLETITVTGTVLAETRTSEIATYVAPKTIEMVPQASRNFLSFAETVPGVQFITGTDGSTSLRSGAQNSNGINVFIDGVGQKNYVLKGGISGQDGTRGNPFPQLAIGEYKVITSNYKAEYDQISSAAVTAVTKSGTNEFEGEVFSDFSVTDMRASTPGEIRTGEKLKSKEIQYGAAFGGPIVKDTLHFFLTYEAKDFNSPREVRLGTDAPPGTLEVLPPELRSLVGPASAPFASDLFFGKLSWLPGDEHIVELSTKYRDETELTNIGNGPNAPSWGTDKTNDELRGDLRWQYSGEVWLNDAHLTYEDATFNPRPITIAPGIRIETPERRTILNSGGGQDFQDKGQKGYSLQDDLTFTGWDRHIIKMGAKYKTVEINAFEQQPFNPQFFYDLTENLDEGNTTVATFIPNRVEFGALLPGAPSRDITSTNKQYGIYIQDDWEVNDKLTLNLGLRYDYEETPAYLDYVTRPDLVSALRGWTNLQNTDYNIEDYISDGNNREAFKDGWQPRLGFSYDLFADERHVIFGGAGRSYDRNLFDYIALEQSKSTFPRYAFQFDTPDHPCTVGEGNCFEFDPSFFDPAFLAALTAANPNLGAEVWGINNELKTPYSDQFSLGMRNALGDWNTSVTLVHVKSKDGILRTLGNRREDGSFFEPGRTFAGAPFGFPVPGFGTLILTDNGIETRLNSLLLSAEKPYTRESGWGVTVAYTFSDAKENRSNAALSDQSFMFQLPNLDGQEFIRSTGIPRHRLVATGVYDAPWDITLSGKLTLASAVTKDAVNCLYSEDNTDCFFDPVTRPGTWGQRQFDFAAEKIWDTGTDVQFRVRMDVLNVFNNRNYLDFMTNREINSDTVPNPDFGKRGDTQDAILLPTRTFKFSLGMRW